MGRGRCTCCGDAYLNRGPWLPEEDELLLAYIKRHGGRGNWRKLPKAAGLLRCGKSCRLRWLNYLRPDLKRGSFSEDEADLIIRLHSLLGNRWALIAGRVPGRSDNEIKNYWNFHLSKKLLSMGINPKTHKPLNNSSYTNIDNTSSGASFNSSSAEKSASPELTWFEQDYNLESTAVSNSSSSDEQQQLRCSSNKFYSRNSSFSSVTSSLSSQSSKRCASPNTPALAEKSMDWTWDSFQNEMVEHNHNLVLSTMQQLEAHLFTDEQGHGGLSDFLQDPGILEGL